MCHSNFFILVSGKTAMAQKMSHTFTGNFSDKLKHISLSAFYGRFGVTSFTEAPVLHNISRGQLPASLMNRALNSQLRVPGYDSWLNNRDKILNDQELSDAGLVSS